MLLYIMLIALLIISFIYMVRSKHLAYGIVGALGVVIALVGLLLATLTSLSN
jgi:hypothetical protein